MLISDKSVALLDADIYGPSIPKMMNLSGMRPFVKDGLIQPLTNYGIECMSMGFLVEEDSPMIWRGPLVMGAIEQLLYKVNLSSNDLL